MAKLGGMGYVRWPEDSRPRAGGFVALALVGGLALLAQGQPAMIANGSKMSEMMGLLSLAGLAAADSFGVP